MTKSVLKNSRSRTLPLVLLWGSVLFILYGTLIPFHFTSHSQYWISKWQDLFSYSYLQLLLQDFSIPDLFQNILFFIPFGFSLLWLQGKTTACWLRMSLFLGFGLSLTVEFLQAFTLDRTSSLLDLAMNTTGSFCGALLYPFASRLGTSTSVTQLRSKVIAYPALRPLLASALGLCIVYWQPFDFSLDWSAFKDKLKVLLGLEQGSTFLSSWFAGQSVFLLQCVFMVSLLGCLQSCNSASGIACDVSKNEIQNKWNHFRFNSKLYKFLLIFIAPVLIAIGLELSQFFITSRAPEWMDLPPALLGLTLGYLVIRILKPSPFQKAFGLLLLTVIAVTFEDLNSLDFVSNPIAFHWIPFYDYYLKTGFVSISDLCNRVLLCMPLGYISCYQSRQWKISVFFLLTFFLFGVEWLQRWSPERVPDITDMLTGILGYLVGLQVAKSLVFGKSND